jgi:hypothetical protein
MKYVLGAAIVIAGLYMLHQFGLRAERRGWIYYRKAGSASSLGNALLEVQTFLEPSKRHIVEARVKEHSEIETAGDKPDSGE